MDILSWNFVRDLPAWHFLEVVDDPVGDAPPDEIELGHRGREALEIDPGSTAKRIKELLGVAVQTRLVGHVYREHLSVRCGIRDVLRLGVVCDEPLEFAQRRDTLGTASSQNVTELLLILGNRIEAL
jgi:hypothetical protein